MGNSRNSFNRLSSPLAALFAERAGFAENPECAIRNLVRQLVETTRSACDLDGLLPVRKIDPVVDLQDDIIGDGVIEPKGYTYDEGFRMRLKTGQSPRRLRFTKAHEICHTFFYELVPEMKFQPHTTDVAEEWLCNVGATELLIPIQRLQVEAAGIPESLDSLDRMVKIFDVSAFALVLRLREAGLWDRELAYWHRMVDGTFVLDTKAGNRKMNWRFDPSLLHAVWDKGGAIETGMTFVYVEKCGYTGATRVYYQAQRRGSKIVTLTGRRKFRNREKKPPLLRALGLETTKDS